MGKVKQSTCPPDLFEDMNQMHFFPRKCHFDAFLCPSKDNPAPIRYLKGKINDGY